ncbi:MAG: hypothetical protein MUO82_07850 [Candidatus Thermoplasmatota archaeon]|nr:hypothetical protein [Candidatus Thermoplasmatota archaeon]
MPSRSKKELIYPFHIRIINNCIKKYTNIYWTIIDFFSIKSPFISDFFYKKRIKEKYEIEHKLIKLKDTDDILHIGCGFFPYSALVLSENNHKSITAIDNNKTVIHHAYNYLHKMQLDERINLDVSNGVSYDVKPFSVIIISACANSTLEIFENIMNHTKPNTRIIIRELWPMSKYLKTIIKNQKKIIIEQEYKHHSYPFIGIFGWNSFILRIK